jgi:hypothetical protein
MQDANNTEQPDDDSDNHQKCESKFNKCETLDEGTFAFMHWLNEDDCAHVGFAICVEQSYGHRRTGTEERIEDIIG